VPGVDGSANVAPSAVIEIDDCSTLIVLARDGLNLPEDADLEIIIFGWSLDQEVDRRGAAGSRSMSRSARARRRGHPARACP